MRRSLREFVKNVAVRVSLNQWLFAITPFVVRRWARPSKLQSISLQLANYLSVDVDGPSTRRTPLVADVNLDESFVEDEEEDEDDNCEGLNQNQSRHLFEEHADDSDSKKNRLLVARGNGWCPSTTARADETSTNEHNVASTSQQREDRAKDDYRQDEVPYLINQTYTIANRQLRVLERYGRAG